MNWIDKGLGIHTRVLMFRADRSEVLAANIANADTPNYKAKDLDFAGFTETLKHAEADMANGAALKMTATDSRHMAPNAASGDLMYRVPTRDAGNGNSVEAEVEQAAFAENALRYQITLQFLDGNVAGLKKALRGE